MRKFIAVFILIGLVVGMYYYYGSVNESLNAKATNELVGLSEDSMLSEIKNNYYELLAKVKKLQENPDQIAEFNCMITKLLYSGKVSDDDIELLLKFQREYFSEETIAKNPEDVNYQRLLMELKEYKDAELSIIGYKVIGPQYVDVEQGEKPMLIFNIIYYLNITSNDGEVYKGYVFQQNDNKLWELKGFGTIEGFPVIY